MNYKQAQIDYRFLILLLFSLLIRALTAGLTEFGNDEVYYRLYALYPNFSHFDHPPMLGWLIQLFTFNLSLSSEFAIRFASIVIGTVNTYLIYKIGTEIKDKNAGYYSALLYTASFYCSVIVGTFIMPDTPQILFWLITLLLFIKFTRCEINSKEYKLNLLLIGLLIGLGMISKYHSIFLWTGFFIFCCFRRRDVFKSVYFYLAVIISIMVLSPVIYWNVCHNFISFTYHSERVQLFSEFRPDYLLTEIIGEIAYNNPINFVLTVTAILSYIIIKKKYCDSKLFELFMAVALPMIFTFLMFSAFRKTLPHWTGPAYTTLIPLSGAFISNSVQYTKKYKVLAIISICLFVAVVSLSFIQINFGVFKIDKNENKATKVGKNDPTLDMFGWNQISYQFKNMFLQDQKNAVFGNSPSIISFRWFPAANLDYYVASPLGIKLTTMGKLSDIHEFYWINKVRGELKKDESAYFLCTSRDFKNPNMIYYDNFEKIVGPDTINILRDKQIAYKLFIYRLIKYKDNFR